MPLPTDPDAAVADDITASMQAEMDADNAAVAAQKKKDDAKELITKLRRRISQGRLHDKHAREKYDRDRKIARGDSQWEVDTNLVNTIIEILLSFIYAKNPDISVDVADSVGEVRAKKYREATHTLEIVVSRLLKDAGLKRQAKRWVRSAMTIGLGWLKVAMQTRTEKDPIIEREINDLQDQLTRVGVLQHNLNESTSDRDSAAIRAEIEANIKALQAKLERKIATGLSIDLMPGQDVQVSPECGELENYLQAPWINFTHYKTREWVQGLTGMSLDELKSAHVYHQRPRGEDDRATDNSGNSPQTQWVRSESGESESVEGFLCIDETWSREDGVVYTMVEGITDRFAREPYAPRTSARFYDVFLLAFHYIDGERHPQSDVQQLAKLQNEYGRTRSNQALHRKRSIPATLIDGSQLDPTQVDKIQRADTQEYIVVTPTNPGDDLRKAFAEKAYAQYDPRIYDTTPITSDIEKVSGAQDAMQSSVQVEKTATEAEIQNNGFGARVGTRKDEVEDVMSEMATHVAQLALQCLSAQQVVDIAGELAVWPEGLTIDEIQCAFDTVVRAGSTGKPNNAAKRSSWQVFLPLIEKIITVIGNFRAAQPPQEWAAQPYIELLKETLARLDDHTDVDRFLPQPPAPAMPGVDPANPLAAILGGASGFAPAAGAPTNPQTVAPGPMQPALESPHAS